MSATAAAETPSPPGVGAWRRRARRARRGHHHRSGRDVFTDLYTLLWFVLIYGGALYSEVNRHLETPGALEGAMERHWLGVAALLAGAGLAWQGLRTLGPIMASPAEQYWALSAPLSRGRWLTPRFVTVVVAGAAVGSLAAAAVVFLGIRGGGTGTAALAGAAFGLAIPAVATVAQGAPTERRWPSGLGWGLMAVGAGLSAAVIAVHYAGGPLPGPPDAAVALLWLGGPLAAAALWTGVRTLPGLDRARLGGGAQVAAAVVTSAVWLDPTVLGRVLEIRKWRRVGWVRRRRIRGGVPGIPDRVVGLLKAEWIRTTRRPGALAVFGGLALGQYAVAVTAPPLTGVARILLAYLAANRLMAGLRTVARADGLRRALGGSEAVLRGSHVVVPALATTLWWLATEPAGAGGPPELGLLLVIGVVAAAYRAAARGPIRHGGAVFDIGLGLLPVDLILQLVRGPDLLGVVILVQVILG